MSVEQIKEPAFLQRNVQRSFVKSLVCQFVQIVFDYFNRMMTGTWCAECNITDTSMENVVAEEEGRYVVKVDVKMTILYGRHFCHAVR